MDRFNETFDDVLLAYSASTNNELAKILPGLNPYFVVRLQARLLLFYPKPDMLLGTPPIALMICSITCGLSNVRYVFLSVFLFHLCDVFYVLNFLMIISSRRKGS